MPNFEQEIKEIHDGYEWMKQDCPICDIQPTKFIGFRGGEAHRESLGVKCEIWSCGKCGLIFPNPMPVPVRGIAQHYESTDAENYFQNHNLTKKDETAKRLLQRAEKWLGKKGKILDIGTGRGEIVRRAKLDGWETVGVEPSESFASFAEEHSGVEIHRSMLEDCNFPNDEFDVVFLSAVLEHLYNPAEVIAEVSRILKKGGFFYFDVPNERGLYFRIGNIYQKLSGTNWSVNLAPTFSPFHVFGFSPKSINMLMEKYNLSIKEMTVYGGTSLVPKGNGLKSKLESVGSKVITRISNIGNLGTYIEAWAIKL